MSKQSSFNPLQVNKAELLPFKAWGKGLDHISCSVLPGPVL